MSGRDKNPALGCLFSGIVTGQWGRDGEGWVHRDRQGSDHDAKTGDADSGDSMKGPLSHGC